MVRPHHAGLPLHNKCQADVTRAEERLFLINAVFRISVVLSIRHPDRR
jgi:hypothetical protein